MRLNTPATPITPRRRYRWLQLVLLIGFSVCFLVSILALATLWWLSAETPTRSTPSFNIQVEQVLPELALMYLAGDPVDALAQQAFQAGENETSHALVTFGIHSMSPTRVPLLLQLAQRFREQERTTLATQLLRYSRAIAILDPQLAPLDQVDILLQCAKEQLTLGLSDEATDTAYQIKYLAEQTPNLLPAERNRMLQELLPLVRQLNDTALLQQVQELARSPYLDPTGMIVQKSLHLIDGSFEFQNELTTLIQRRQQLARQLAEQLLTAPIANTEPLQEALRQALLLEDEQRSLYFTQILGSQNLTFSLQFWTLHEQQNWLILKLAVANRAFGLSLVPAWEENQVTLFDELTAVTDQLEIALATVPEAEPSPFDQLLQRIAALRWLALQTELGFYSERRAVEVGEQLRIAQQELAAHGTAAALPIYYDREATPPGYRIEHTR